MKCFTVFVITSLFCSFFQNEEVIYFSKNGLEGVIFNDPYPLNYSTNNKRWKPSVSDVLFVDSMMLIENFEKLGGFIQDSILHDSPVITNNWKNYIRQVVGEVDSENDSILEIDYLWKPEIHRFPEWKQSRVYVIGGNSYYWGVRYNFSKNKTDRIWIY